MYHDQQAARSLGQVNRESDMSQKQRASQEFIGSGSGLVGAIAGGRDRGALEVTLDRSASAIDELQAAISGLESRLQQVMLPDAPQPVAAETRASTPVFSPAVGYLQNLVERTNNLRYRINAIAQRLDL